MLLLALISQEPVDFGSIPPPRNRLPQVLKVYVFSGHVAAVVLEPAVKVDVSIRFITSCSHRSSGFIDSYCAITERTQPKELRMDVGVCLDISIRPYYR